MVIYSDEMAESHSVITNSYQIMADLDAAGHYNPPKSGRLKKIRLIAGGDAATSLFDGNILVKVESTTFAGVPVVVAMSTAGIRTAPVGQNLEAEQICDVPVSSGVFLTCSIKQVTAGTPVTPRFSLVGTFEG
jgi:hypothetical protein